MLQTRPAVRWLRMCGWQFSLLICTLVLLIQSVGESPLRSKAIAGVTSLIGWSRTVSEVDVYNKLPGPISANLEAKSQTHLALYCRSAKVSENVRPSSGSGGVLPAKDRAAGLTVPNLALPTMRAGVPSWGARVLRALSAAISSTLGATRRRPGQTELAF